MSYQSGSDVGVQILLVARDGIRFDFVGLRRPFHAEPPEEALPDRRVWVQAASPPPPRIGGTPWYEPYTAAAGLPAFLSAPRFVAAPQYDGLQKLDKPARDTIVLDQEIKVPFQWAREADFDLAEIGNPTGFLANPYPQPRGWVGVDFHGEFTLRWATEVEPGHWVAISFDRFDPDPAVQSAAYLAQVTDAKLFGPPKGHYPKALAAD
jgi:hypothetical protein